MFQMDIGKLNSLEMAIHNTISAAAKSEKNLKITQAAQLCDVSPSKISKFAKKLGFSGYKDYIGFVYGRGKTDKNQKGNSDEIKRLKGFIDDFDMKVIDDLLALIGRYERIVLFGYGPSYICAEYFEYKFKIIAQKFIVSANEESVVKNLINEDSLLIVFSATGKFRSFFELFAHAKEKKAGYVLIVEEYNTELLKDIDNVIFLTNSFQNNNLDPYLKSRSTFFILIEVLMQRLISAHKGGDTN